VSTSNYNFSNYRETIQLYAFTELKLKRKGIKGDLKQRKERDPYPHPKEGVGG
jgi:hypothetical protein